MKTILFLLLALMLPSPAHSEIRLFGVIAAGDSLQLSITGVAQESRANITSNYMISKSGYLKMPHLKNLIKAEGRTHSELAREIEAAYTKAKIFTNPTIRVNPRDGGCGGCGIQKPQKFVQVSGQVRAPGSKPWRQGMTLMEVISLAAPNKSALMSEIQLTRNHKNYTYNLKTKTAHQLLKVYPNDQIVVPQKSQVDK